MENAPPRVRIGNRFYGGVSELQWSDFDPRKKKRVESSRSRPALALSSSGPPRNRPFPCVVCLQASCLAFAVSSQSGIASLGMGADPAAPRLQ